MFVCDVCGTDDARRTTIIIDDTAWRADLCIQHLEPLNLILLHARESRLSPRTRGSLEKVSLQHLFEMVKEAGDEHGS